MKAIYERHLAAKTPITPHLKTLRRLASECDVVVEFGVQHGASSSALLMGAKRVVSYDIKETSEARELEAVAPHWEYRIEDSGLVLIPMCDMLFIDTRHTYEQCKAELEQADRVHEILVFHDTITFGSIGDKDGHGNQKWAYQQGQSVPLDCLGIRPAIDELMVRDDSWRIAESYPYSHGLLVLRRR